VHVQRDEANAKFWLDSVRLDRSQRFPAQNLQAPEIGGASSIGIQEKMA
jgi:hypothetical protein